MSKMISVYNLNHAQMLTKLNITAGARVNFKAIGWSKVRKIILTLSRIKIRNLKTPRR